MKEVDGEFTRDGRLVLRQLVRPNRTSSKLFIFPSGLMADLYVNQDTLHGQANYNIWKDAEQAEYHRIGTEEPEHLAVEVKKGAWDPKQR